jgi:GAF domain-containing protein
MHIDTAALKDSLEQIRSAPRETDLVASMERIIAAVNLLFDYDGAGVMFVDDGGDLRYIASSDETGRKLEEAQLAAGQGPCVDTYLHDRVVTSKDVHSDLRWPGLSQHLDQGIQAVAGAPIHLGGGPVGTLNVYRSIAQEWDASDTSALTAYTALVGEILAAALAARDHSVLAGQLQYALDYRVIIERAIGFLMGRDGLDANEAFQRLRTEARGQRRRVADLAAELLGDPTTPPAPPADGDSR